MIFLNYLSKYCYSFPVPDSILWHFEGWQLCSRTALRVTADWKMSIFYSTCIWFKSSPWSEQPQQQESSFSVCLHRVLFNNGSFRSGLHPQESYVIVSSFQFVTFAIFFIEEISYERWHLRTSQLLQFRVPRHLGVNLKARILQFTLPQGSLTRPVKTYSCPGVNKAVPRTSLSSIFASPSKRTCSNIYKLPEFHILLKVLALM